MVSQVHWIVKGRIEAAPAGTETGQIDERDLLHRKGYVKIVQDEYGTTVKWAMFASNWSSVYFAMEWIHGAGGPYHLQFYSAGWFSERYDTAAEAADRMGQLIYKSDIHLSSTVYIHEASTDRSDIPVLLKTALQDQKASPDNSIDCIFDPMSRKFRVSRVGAESPIAKFYGLSPISYPCLTGHSYDAVVSQAYPKVSKTGEPHYDHIYAAFGTPTGDVIWVPYQRVVLPLREGRNKKGVRIVTELAKVDISPF